MHDVGIHRNHLDARKGCKGRSLANERVSLFQMAKEPACLNESSSVLQRDDLDADVDHRQSVLNALIVQDKEEVSIHQITRCCCPRTLYRELLLRQDMPLAPVDDQGTQLHYADSGKTPSARTLMCLHGFSFNLTSFSSIMDIAPKHDIRIIGLYATYRSAALVR